MAISVDRSVILGETARSKSTVVPNQRNTSQFTAKRIEMSEPTVDGPLMAVQIYNTQGVNCMCIYIYTWRFILQEILSGFGFTVISVVSGF